MWEPMRRDGDGHPADAMKGRRDATKDFFASPCQQEAQRVNLQNASSPVTGCCFPVPKRGVISDMTMTALRSTAA